MGSVEELCKRAIGTCEALEAGIEARDYEAVRTLVSRLDDAASSLNGILDLMLGKHEQQCLVAAHDAVAEYWLKGSRILGAYDDGLAKEMPVVVPKWMPAEKPEAELERLRDENRGDVAAVAALLHWVRQDYDSGYFLVGAATSSALVELEERFAGRLAELNKSLAAEGRALWDLRR